MTTRCTHCSAPARWRDGNGLAFCGSHVPTNGKPLVRLPPPPEPQADILERLDRVLRESELLTISQIGWHDGGGVFRVSSRVVEDAAVEIRRLRALMPPNGHQPGV
jgi:hypothetical protein